VKRQTGGGVGGSRTINPRRERLAMKRAVRLWFVYLLAGAALSHSACEPVSTREAGDWPPHGMQSVEDPTSHVSLES